MKVVRFILSSFKRTAVSKWITLTLVTILSLPFSGSATLRGEMSSRASGVRPVSTVGAPLVGLIEVNSTGDGDNLNPSAGCDTDAATLGDQCSLRAALQRANALTGDDEIRFNIPSSQPNCDATSGSCIINLTNALPPLATNVRIIGPGSNKLTVRRATGGDYRIFTVTAATDITISGLVISSGRPFGVSSGGGIANAGNATIDIIDSVLTNNFGGADGGDGGAIANAGGGTVNVINSTIAENTANVPVVDGASGGGGGIINTSNGTVNITNSIIFGNKVVGGRRNSVMVGGGVYNASTGAVNITGSFMSSNVLTVTGSSGAYGGGGGIANAAGDVSVTNSVVSDHFVSGGDPFVPERLKGGGIFNQSTGVLNVTGSVFFNNQINGSGGGISNVSGSLRIINSTLTANRGSGAGLFGQGTVKSSIVAKNGLSAQ